MRLASDPLRRAVFALIVMSVGRLHMHFPAILVLRPALVATGLIAMYMYLRPGLLSRGSLARTWPAKVILGFFVLACLSTPFGISMGNSGAMMVHGYTKTVVLSLVIIAAIRGARDLYTVSWALVASCGILAYLALFVFHLSRGEAGARLDDLYTYDANDVGVLLTTGIAFALLHVKTSRPVGKVVALVLLLMMCGAVARTGSRGAMIGMVAGGLALLFLAQGVSFVGRIVTVGVAIVALSLAAPEGYWKQMMTIFAPEDDYNYTEATGRKQTAQRGIGYMLERPLLGVGINNFSKAECMISPRARDNSYRGPLRCMPPHNSYVQVGAELGVGGLALWIGMMLGGIFGPIALRRRMPAHWREGDAEERFLFYASVYFPVGMAAFALTSFFLTFAWMDFTYLLMAYLAGLIVATDVKVRQNQQFPPPPAQPSLRELNRARRGRKGPVTPTLSPALNSISSPPVG